MREMKRQQFSQENKKEKIKNLSGVNKYTYFGVQGM